MDEDKGQWAEVAEEGIVGPSNDDDGTTAADDLAKVTDIARSMALRFGMVEKLGHVSLEEPRQTFLNSPISWRVVIERDIRGMRLTPSLAAAARMHFI